MSWFAKSLVNTLRGEEEDDDDRGVPLETVAGRGWNEEDQGNVQGEENGSPSRGVKEDLSELTKTLTRRLWGVASFLVPPPTSTEGEDEEEGSSSPDPSGRGGLDVAEEESDDAATAADSPRLAGIRSDFAEISGKVRSGISMLSQAKAVAEISKLASSLLPFGSDEDWDEDEEEVEKIVEDAVGVTEDVVVFARSIAMHPETWLGFPLLNSDDFEISDAQLKHALAVEHFAPGLADLRIELCPSRVSEANFWKIYFVLLHSRLDKQDAELLSTPQILEARTMLLQDSQIPKGQGSVSTERVGIHMKEDETVVSSERNLAPPSGLLDKSTQSAAASDTTLPKADIETGKHAVETNELKFVDKSVTEEAVKHDKTKDLPHDVYQVPTAQHEKDEDDGDYWLDDATGEETRTAVMHLGQEEDVSFSDLEDEDTESEIRVSSSKTEDSRDWVQLNKDGKGSTEGSNSTSPPSKEASDWLNLEDIDVE